MSAAGGFRWPLRVYWEDTDGGGVVYHAAYLRFLERGRTELLRALGIGQRELAAREGIVFAIRRVALDYLRPARLDDRLEVLTRLIRLGRASCRFAQRIEREGAPVAEAVVDAACLRADDFRPTPLPDPIRALLATVLSPE
ncbi:MAG: tol-pal system-associated acyl-CoA thioesterase [Xanthomonadales bacterium]|nr:tol-pal system-associated acyl-CoA thioesterase [Xanthomonadales bacterium]